MASPSAEGYDPIGYEQVTLPGTLTVPADAARCLLNIEVQSVRWRDDGIAPTTTVGMLVKADGSFWYEGDLESLKFTTVTAGGIVNVSYYR